MIDLAAGHFVKLAFSSATGTWDEGSTRLLAHQSPPDAIGGTASWLLFGDAKALWARWFLEAFADPLLFSDERLRYPYPHLFKQVRDSVADVANAMPADERLQLTRALTELLWREVSRRVSVRRVRANRAMRLLLWELHPRCWICGSVFPEWARAAFLGEETATDPAPLPFVDFFRPRGTRVTDLRIEVEHVVPLAGGGTDELSNLRLACGWCNRAKGSRTLLYDAEGRPRVFRHPTLGITSVPQPFWVIRLLAMRPRCEDQSGCPARADTQELTVAPHRLRGAPNPANLKVVCSEHDPLADVRLVAARLLIENARSRSVT